MPRTPRRVPISSVLVLSAALATTATSARAATVYIDHPSASDAQKIATQMLNDASSKPIHIFDRANAPVNPFTRMIEEYEARQRARALDMEEAARHARERLAEQAAEERRWREQEARAERARQELARFDAIQNEAADLHPMAHVRLGMAFESGRYDSQLIQPPRGMTPRAYAAARYVQAAELDLPLGEIAHAFLQRQLSPPFPLLWDTLQGLADGPARRAHLESLAFNGHVGAAYWLGAWAAGRNVGLGDFPLPPGGVSARRYAIDWLGRADPQRLGALQADLILQDNPGPAARRDAIARLERLAVPTDDGDAHAYIALARELFRQARFESDMERPRTLLGIFHKADIVPGMRALAGMYFDGTDGLFRPTEAARVYQRMPEKPRFLALRARARIFEGINAVLGVDRPADPSVALERFEEAERILARVPGAYRPDDRGLKVETILWRQFARAEMGVTGTGTNDPVEFLMEYGDAGGGLGRLLFRCGHLGRRTTSPLQASHIWTRIRVESPFTAPLSPAEVLLYLRCAVRAHERGGAPDLDPVIASVRDLPPREAPIRGAALLTRMAFLPAEMGRDAANRSGLADAYAALFRAAWRDPSLWGETAALVEVLQIDPLDAQAWTRGWLAPWLADASESGRQARAWAEVLRNPGAAAWKEASGRPWGRLVQSLLGDSAPAYTPTVAALRDSLQLRASTDGPSSEAAFRSLMGLAREGHWHAQALLNDFEARYGVIYARHGSQRLFREHAREVAEAFAEWRDKGFAFCRIDHDARWRAIGRALEAGSIRYTRAQLEEAVKTGSEDARIALLRLDAATEGTTSRKP